MTERPLGRLAEFDERSRQYPARQLFGTAGRPHRSYTWRVGATLDQGSHPHCVGFAFTHEMVARPAEVAVGTQTARWLYRIAQENDRWPGTDYDGTSILGGAKAARIMGLVGEYRWAFGVEDVAQTVGYHGPVVVGVNWYEGMFTPTAEGELRPEGALSGGHAVLVNQVDVTRGRFGIHNSWGHRWGDRGTAWVTWETLDRLLREDGEACILLQRARSWR